MLDSVATVSYTHLDVYKRQEDYYTHHNNRLTKQIFKYLWGKKSTSSWIKEVQKDLEKNNIHAEEAFERDVFRAKVLKMEGVQSRREINAGSKQTEDRKKRHSENMKEYWKKEKNKE